MLKLTGVDTFYGRAQALFGARLDVRRGEVVALLGRNGAGKSTLLKSIMGLVPASAGTIVFEDRELRGMETHRIARFGIGYVPEERRIFTDLSVAENLEVGRAPSRPDAPEWTVERVIELFPNLAPLMQRSGGHLSGGEQQMLAVARSLMGNPKMILLDEPSEGLAPRVVEAMGAMIVRLKSEGLTAILAEQSLRLAGLVADRAYVMESGTVVWDGTGRDFLADHEAQKRYLMA